MAGLMRKFFHVPRHVFCRSRVLIVVLLMFSILLTIQNSVRQASSLDQLEQKEYFRQAIKVKNNAHVNPNYEYLPFCDHEIRVLTPMTINSTVPSWEHLERRFTMLQDGGHYQPYDCRARKKVAIIIPFRNRTNHLKLFLQHMHPFLQIQKLDYKIFVAEQEAGVIFKKGLLMNAGFIESVKLWKADCVIFHDVDMLPADAMLSYLCSNTTVKHPTLFVRQYGFGLPRGLENYFGGVLIFSEASYRKVNGFSNLYWGWGGEDDDMRTRVTAMKIPIEQPKDKNLWYESWTHGHEPSLVNRFQFYLRAKSRMHQEGLNSANYTLLKIEHRPLYTWIYVACNDTKHFYKDLIPQNKPY